jgi:hypothetical protein
MKRLEIIKLLDEHKTGGANGTSAFAGFDRQNDYLRRTYQLLDLRRLRITIRIDHSYDYQGHGQAELWDGITWHEVASCLGQELGSDKFVAEHRLFEESMRVLYGEKSEPPPL